MALGKFDGIADSNINKIINVSAANIGNVGGGGALSTKVQATGGVVKDITGYRLHYFTYLAPKITTIKFYVKGAGDYPSDGEFYIFDIFGNWIRWVFSYTTSWTEIILTASNYTSFTSNYLAWNSIDYYRFDLNTTGRTVRIDNIRMYDASNNLIHSNLCNNVTDWVNGGNGTVSYDATDKQEGSGSIKIVSSANDCWNYYQPTGTWDWSIVNTDSFVVSSGGSVEYLVVAGGGGGGGGYDYLTNAQGGGGGGGAGGMLTGTLAVTPQTYTVTVGSGGAGGTGGGSNQSGSKGVNSVFSTVTATGGGYGGKGCATNGGGGAGGGAGGSGGGAGGGTTLTGGLGTSGQGNDGGAGTHGSGGTPFSGGGGGGASHAGYSVPGNGGAGLSNSITGSSVTRAGGGGAGKCSHSGWVNSDKGTGGDGGGGAGGDGGVGGIIGAVNTGGGGGGGGYSGGTGGKGGSGIIIIRYLI